MEQKRRYKQYPRRFKEEAIALVLEQATLYLTTTIERRSPTQLHDLC